MIKIVFLFIFVSAGLFAEFDRRYEYEKERYGTQTAMKLHHDRKIRDMQQNHKDLSKDEYDKLLNADKRRYKERDRDDDRRENKQNNTTVIIVK